MPVFQKIGCLVRIFLLFYFQAMMISLSSQILSCLNKNGHLNKAATHCRNHVKRRASMISTISKGN
jgi:hypothetical protein